MTEAKELGREGSPHTPTSRGGSGAATECPPEGRERPQEGTGAPRSRICGCGEPVRGKKSRFRPGHDARLHSELKRNLDKDPLLLNERFTDEQKAYAKERKLI